MIKTSSFYDNHLFASLQEEHREKIKKLELVISDLQQEIKLLEDYKNRIYDL